MSGLIPVRAQKYPLKPFAVAALETVHSRKRLQAVNQPASSPKVTVRKLNAPPASCSMRMKPAII